MKMLVKIWNIFADVLLVVALVLVFAFVGAKFIGYTPYVVTSGSMQSIYPVGSIIYVKDAKPQDVQVGDAITFYLSGDTVATHQVWESSVIVSIGLATFKLSLIPSKNPTIVITSCPYFAATSFKVPRTSSSGFFKSST